VCKGQYVRKEALSEGDRLSEIFGPSEPAERTLSIVVRVRRVGECV
jgi:hypothetical protein